MLLCYRADDDDSTRRTVTGGEMGIPRGVARPQGRPRPPDDQSGDLVSHRNPLGAINNPSARNSNQSPWRKKSEGPECSVSSRTGNQAFRARGC